RLERLPKYRILTEPRRKPFRYKEQIVVEKEFENQKLLGEDVTEIEYQPGKCGYPYRVVILRKNISVQRGEKVLFDEVRYFFYITNRPTRRPRLLGWPMGGVIKRTSLSR